MGVGVATASLFYTVYTTEEQKSEQREIDRLNEANLAAESKEAERRVGESNARTAILLRSAAAASGFAAGGSKSEYVGSIIQEQQRELDWMKTSGASRLSIMRAESSARMRLLNAQQAAGIFKGIGGAYSAGVKEGYWGT